ncbi:hypothetical protein SAMN05660653_02453 [Desulfonatronum thiosulfatophilum]|uniref:Uncharacterized protein n=1 Tax=Desulfonatronum thiosulfatophilum TaxID=617002 RepID=A0A1G6DXG8_9BACT|nr:hypothetical protein [Desulfonatronum thiosulfatophilum]SDB49887.1 hypothetical protein SAMN05660653_02453 [Desulfonatronum thiosulfatophilum]
MKYFLALLLALTLLLSFSPAMAQQVASSPEHSSATVAELERLIDAMYADLESLRQNTSPGMQEILAVGTGAGLGFLASGWVMTGILSPMVYGYAGAVGFSELTASLLTASVTTIGIVSGTYAGGMYARNLVMD